MTELAKYEVYYKKLQGICDENGLVFSFKKDVYPIRLTVRPTNDVSGQMAMMEMVEEKGYTSPDAFLSFYYQDGELMQKTSRTLTMSDTLIGKLRSLYKNMHYLWLQYFQRDMTGGRIDPALLPKVTELEEAEPLEELDDLDDLDEDEPDEDLPELDDLEEDDDESGI